MMRKQIGSKPVVLLQLLKEESDEEHPLSSPALLSGMSEAFNDLFANVA